MQYTHDFDGHRETPPPPRKRRSYFVPYLILFGVIIGVLLTNTIRPLIHREGRVGGDTSQNAETAPAVSQAVSQQPSATAVTTEMLTDYERAVIAAANRAKPAVVTIRTSGTQYVRYRHPIFDMLYGVREQPVGVIGSGVIVDPDGTVITNEHVIDAVSEIRNVRNARISVELPDGRQFDAVVDRALFNQDLAILRIEGENLPYVELSEGDVVQGQTVLAIGNPFGFSYGGQPTITRGIVSATNRNLRFSAESGTKYLRNMIQTDASINEGNSGGALIDLNGRLVGINTAIYAAGGEGSIGIGFAIPARQVSFFLDSVAKYGEGGNITSGLSVQPLNARLAGALEFTGRGGVVISEVAPDSPGEKYGFKPGDIITKINGFSVQTIDQARDILRGAFPGEQFELEVFRAGGFVTIPLILGEKE